MGIWAVLPVKPLRYGKSRLAQAISDKDRESLNHCLLEHTLRVLADTPGIDSTLVISRDPQALAMARRYRARTLLENSTSNLNRALEVASALIKRATHRGVLLIPTDLPLLDANDLLPLVDAARKPPVVAIAPDRHYMGTNALMVSPPGLIRYIFGPHSFKKHCALAESVGARLEIIERPGLSLDLDTPEDLELVHAHLAALEDEPVKDGENLYRWLDLYSLDIR